LDNLAPLVATAHKVREQARRHGEAFGCARAVELPVGVAFNEAFSAEVAAPALAAGCVVAFNMDGVMGFPS
jgi:hypothetical protein